MQAAFYYPHSSIQNAELIKTVLLLWDQIDYIRPDWFSPPEPSDPKTKKVKKVIDEAMELVGNHRMPTESEQELVDQQVDMLIQSKLPEWLFFVPENEHLKYNILPDKLLHKTWNRLREAGLVGRDPNPVPGYDFHDWAMHKSLGLTLMSILARVCAGNQKHMITDEGDAYATWTRELTTLAQGKYGNVEMVQNGSSDEKFLVTESLYTIATKPLSLTSILKLRKREIYGKDTILPQLRENYYAELNSYVNQLSKCKGKNDREEIIRQFRQAMRNDLARLKRELKLETRKTLWSRDMATGIVFTIGTFFEPFISSTIGVGALGSTITPATGVIAAWALNRTLLDYQTGREGILSKHPTSWLYMIKPSLMY